MAALEAILDPHEWVIDDHPADLKRIIFDQYGVVPEAKITHFPSGRYVYFEVKKQGPRGNAEERACKHHTVQFYKEIHKITGLDYHPFVTVMCENLATDARYTIKHPFYFEPDHYMLWVDYDLDLLADHLALITDKWIIPKASIEPDEIPE